MLLRVSLNYIHDLDRILLYFTQILLVWTTADVSQPALRTGLQRSMELAHYIPLTYNGKPQMLKKLSRI
jgi:hypothetical protein